MAESPQERSPGVLSRIGSWFSWGWGSPALGGDVPNSETQPSDQEEASDEDNTETSSTSEIDSSAVADIRDHSPVLAEGSPSPTQNAKNLTIGSGGGDWAGVRQRGRTFQRQKIQVYLEETSEDDSEPFIRNTIKKSKQSQSLESYRRKTRAPAQLTSDLSDQEESDQMGRRRSGKRRRSSHGEGGGPETKSPTKTQPGSPATTSLATSPKTAWVDSSFGEVPKAVSECSSAQPPISPGAGSFEDNVRAEWVEAYLSEDAADTMSSPDGPVQATLADIIDCKMDEEPVMRLTETPESKRRSLKVSHSEKVFAKKVMVTPVVHTEDQREKFKAARDTTDLKLKRTDDGARRPEQNVDITTVKSSHHVGRIADKISLFESCGVQAVKRGSTNLQRLDISPARKVSRHLREFTGPAETRSSSAPPSQTVKERALNFNTGQRRDETFALPSGRWGVSGQTLKDGHSKTTGQTSQYSENIGKPTANTRTSWEKPEVKLKAPSNTDQTDSKSQNSTLSESKSDSKNGNKEAETTNCSLQTVSSPTDETSQVKSPSRTGSRSKKRRSKDVVQPLSPTSKNKKETVQGKQALKDEKSTLEITIDTNPLKDTKNASKTTDKYLKSTSEKAATKNSEEIVKNKPKVPQKLANSMEILPSTKKTQDSDSQRLPSPQTVTSAFGTQPLCSPTSRKKNSQTESSSIVEQIGPVDLKSETEEKQNFNKKQPVPEHSEREQGEEQKNRGTIVNTLFGELEEPDPSVTKEEKPPFPEDLKEGSSEDLSAPANSIPAASWKDAMQNRENETDEKVLPEKDTATCVPQGKSISENDSKSDKVQTPSKRDQKDCLTAITNKSKKNYNVTETTNQNLAIKSTVTPKHSNVVNTTKTTKQNIDEENNLLLSTKTTEKDTTTELTSQTTEKDRALTTTNSEDLKNQNDQMDSKISPQIPPTEERAHKKGVPSPSSQSESREEQKTQTAANDRGLKQEQEGIRASTETEGGDTTETQSEMTLKVNGKKRKEKKGDQSGEKIFCSSNEDTFPAIPSINENLLFSSAKKKPTSLSSTANDIFTEQPGQANEKAISKPASTDETASNLPASVGEKAVPLTNSLHEKNTSPPAFNNEKTTPPPASCNEKSTPPPASLNEKTTPPPTSSNEKTTTPLTSLNEKTRSPPASSNEKTTPPPAFNNENSTPPSASSNEKTMPPLASSKEKTTPPPASCNEKTTPPPASLNEKTAPPPTSSKEKSTTPLISLNEKSTPPPTSSNGKTTPPLASSNEKTTPPPASRNEKTMTPLTSLNEKTRPPLALSDEMTTPPPAFNNENSMPPSTSSNKKATPPPASCKKNTTPPPTSLNEKSTPPPTSSNEKTTPPLASSNEKTTPPPASCNEKTTPSPASLNEKTTPPPISSDEKTIKLHTSFNEKTAPSPALSKEKTTPPLISTNEKTTPPSALSNEKTIPSPTSSNGKTTPPTASLNEKTTPPLASLNEKITPSPTLKNEKNMPHQVQVNEVSHTLASASEKSPSPLSPIKHQSTDQATRKKEFIPKPFILPQIPSAPGRPSLNRDSPSSWLDVDHQQPKRKNQFQTISEPKLKLSSSVSETNLLDKSGEFDPDDFIANVKRLAMPFSLPQRKHNQLRLQAPPFAMPAIREVRCETPFDPEEFQFGLRRRKREFTLDMAPTSISKSQNIEDKEDVSSTPKQINPERESILTRSLLFQRAKKEPEEKDEGQKKEGSEERKTEPLARSRLERCSILNSLRNPSRVRRMDLLSPTEHPSEGLLSPSDAPGSSTPQQTHPKPTAESPKQDKVKEVPANNEQTGANSTQTGSQVDLKPMNYEGPAITLDLNTTSENPTVTMLTDTNASHPPSFTHTGSQVIPKPAKDDGLVVTPDRKSISADPTVSIVTEANGLLPSNCTKTSYQVAPQPIKDDGPARILDLTTTLEDSMVTMLTDTNASSPNSCNQTNSQVVLKPTNNDVPAMTSDLKTSVNPTITMITEADGPPPLPSFDDIKLPSYVEKFLPKEPERVPPSHKIDSLVTRESDYIPDLNQTVKDNAAITEDLSILPSSQPSEAQTSQDDIQREQPNIPAVRGFHRRPGKIVIFEHHQFSGHSFEFYRDEPDATHLQLSSVISVKVVRGCWILFEKPGFEGRCIALEEEGITELPNEWAEEAGQTSTPMIIGSIRLSVRDYTPPQIELFMEPSGMGRNFLYVEDTEEVGSFGLPQNTSSIKVHSGLWMVYSDPGFQGLLAVLEVGEYPIPESWGFPSPMVGSMRALRMGVLKVENPNGVKAVLYEKAGLKGHCMEVQGDVFSFRRRETDRSDLDGHGLRCVESLKIIGGLWVGYEREGFEGQQFVLEEGEYLDWRDWGGMGQKLLSLRPVITDVSSPHMKMFNDFDFGERGGNIDLLEPLENTAETSYGPHTCSIDVLSGVWVAFEDPGFSGQLYVLEKGLYGSPEDWGASNSRISSVIPVTQENLGGTCHFKIQLFSEAELSGMSVLLDDSLPTMPDGFTMRSCRVLAGSWLAFAVECFSGPQCVLEEGIYPDLRSMGFTQHDASVMSLQPTGHEFSLPSIGLFERSGLRGRRTLLKSSSVNLQFTDSCTRVSSILVEGGMWVLYESNNFRGSQFLLRPGVVPDWSKLSDWPRIGSLRPLIQKQAHFRLRNKEVGLLMSITGQLGDIKLMRIQAAEETGGMDQIWLYRDGQLQCMWLADCCVDVSSGVPMAGSRAVLSSEPGQSQQLWNITTDGLIRNNAAPNLVLEIKGGQQFDKTQIILNEFNPNKMNQRWSLEIL